jgi:uncharacterized LabA/DUF88 family protein
MADTRLKIAVFIDFDNVEIGVKTTLGLHFDVGAVLEAIKEHGEIITKVAYGDWKRAGEYGRAMSNHAVRLVQRVMTPGGDKNGADINLALDALEMAFTHSHINAFVIVGGDSDFITLVEKLKQYDRKVFVVGGRAFTSQVMQKNCTQFIAYENIAPNQRPSQTSTPIRNERGRSSGPAAPLDQALPLVKRALKVLADREVTPQLGLLKSTLLQLDSSFSERDYGASTFRDFAEKLAERGLVSLKHAGRSTHVELLDTSSDEPVTTALAPALSEGSEPVLARPAAPDAPAAQDVPTRRADSEQVSLVDGVAMVRRVLFEAPSPPRWPLYLRQMKQFLRSGQSDFDERKYGSIVDLMRACQKEGIVRLERDRQGGLRVFAGTSAYRTPHEPQQAWGLPDDQEVQALEEAAAARLAAVDAAATESGLGSWRDDDMGNGVDLLSDVDAASNVEEPGEIAEADADAAAQVSNIEPLPEITEDDQQEPVADVARPTPRAPRTRRAPRTVHTDDESDAAPAKPKRARKTTTAAKTSRRKAR